MSTGVSYGSGANPMTKEIGDRRGYPIASGETIETGDAVGEDGNGYARRLQAGDIFLGFAEGNGQNIDPGSVASTNIRVISKGNIQGAISGLAIGSNSRPAVYMSDHETFTLSSTNNSLIGFVSSWVETGIGFIEYDAFTVLAATH